MKFRDDGSPISANSIALKAGGKVDLSSEEQENLIKMLNRANEFHLATIREIRYVDDLLNQSKNQTEYRIRVEFGPRHGQEYDSVQVMNLFGGVVNFSETILSAKEKVTKDSRDAEDQYMFNHDASLVVIGFMDGEKNTPFIIGGFTNTNFDTLITKRADGIRTLWEFNGIRFEINDSGEVSLTYYGGKRDTVKKTTARPNTAPTTIKIAQDGSIQIDDKENQQVKINTTDKKITLTQFANVKPDETYGETDSSAPGEIINQISLDKSGKKIEMKTGAGVLVTLDQTANKITLTAGSTIINIDGASGKIELTGSLVDVGEAASALAVLGPQLVSWLTTHTHTYSPGPLAPVPTTPPIVPPPSTVLSASVKLKT